MGHQRAVHQRLAGTNEGARVDAEVLAVRDEVLAFDARLALDDDGALAAALLAEDFHDAVDFGDDRRVLGLAGLEDFGHPRQAAGDVLRAGDLARRLGQQRAGRDPVAFLDLDVGLFGQVVEVEDLAAVVFQHDLRVQVALVLGDDLALVAAGVLLDADRLALDDVLVADLAADFGQDGDAVRVPLAEHRARRNLLVLLDQQIGAGGDFVLLQLAALRVQQEHFAVAGQDDVLALVVADDLHAGELDDAALLGLDFAFLDGAGRGAADVERPHRQLRARLADALGADDAHRHALLHQRAGGEVHAVAAGADAQRRVAGHRAADLDLLQAHGLDLPRDLHGDQFVFADHTSSVMGLTMFARLTRPLIESARLTSTFSPR